MKRGILKGIKHGGTAEGSSSFYPEKIIEKAGVKRQIYLLVICGNKILQNN